MSDNKPAGSLEKYETSDELKTVTIPKWEYDQLVADSKMLRHLEACGVDNWEGYSEP